MTLLQLEALIKMAYSKGSNSFTLLTSIFDLKYQDLTLSGTNFIVDYFLDEYLITVDFNGTVYYCEIFVLGFCVKSFVFTSVAAKVYSLKYKKYIAV